MTEQILNQLIYFAYLQSVFLVGIYLFSPSTRKKINSFVLVLVLVLMVGLSGRVLFMSGFFGNTKIIFLSEMATLLFGSTIYLFTRSSLYLRPFSRRDLIHYAPAIIYNVLLVLFFVVPAIASNSEQGSEAYYVKTLIFVGVGLLVNLSYYLASLGLFIEFRNRIEQETSHVLRLKFFTYFLAAIGLCMISWTTIYGLELGGFKVLSKQIWQLIWFSIAIIILLLAFYTIREPEVFGFKLEPASKKYQNSKLSVDDMEVLKLRLEKIMVEQKPYLNRKLLKAELAKLLQISNPEMSRVLNEKIGMNFFEFVNHYRINEFIRLASSEKGIHMSFFGLAQEAGFNSKTTFNKSFKMRMGKTPKSYLQELRA